jgi:ketosteroid isomerase-like protein
MIGTWLHARNVRAAFAHFSRHDLNAFLAPMAPEVVLEYPGPSAWAGRFEGKEAMGAWIQRYMDRFPRIEFTVKRVCVEKPFGLTSNVATAEWDVTVTDRAGRSFSYGGVTVIRVERAKVVLAKDYIYCSPEMQAALPREPAAGTAAG